MGKAEAKSDHQAPGPLIVLVEDEEVIRTLLFRILSGHGYRTECFSSARAALAWLDADSPAFDLLITDVRMPGMSGKELADEICKRRRDAKILFISGFSSYAQEDMNPCGNRAETLLRKPFLPADLLESVKSILEG